MEDVGAHTLALTLIGERLREAPGGYKGALAKLREAGRLDRIEDLARDLQPLLGEKARGILATFEVSITALDEDAQVLLAGAAVCAPNEPIPVPLLAAVFAGRGCVRPGAFATAARFAAHAPPRPRAGGGAGRNPSAGRRCCSAVAVGVGGGTC